MHRSKGFAFCSAAFALLSATSAFAAMPAFGVVTPNRKVRPNDAPMTSKGAALEAARNEFEAFQIVFTAPSGAASGVSAKVAGALSGPGGTSIPKRAVTLYRAAYYDVGAASNDEGAPGLWPDPLVPDVDTYVGETRNAFPFDVPAGASRVVWVDVLVPADAAPGDYTGSIEIDAAGAKIGSVPISLHVGTFSLPSTPSLATQFGMGWSDPCLAHTGDDYCGDPNFDEHPADRLRALYVRAALEHRFTISPIDFQPPFGGSRAPFEETLLPYVEGTGACRLAGAKVTSVVIDGGDASLQGWVDYAKQKGFFDRLVYYPTDEPGSNASAWAAFVGHAEALHAVDPDAKILITSTIDEAMAQGADGDVDRFVPVIDQLEGRPDSAYPGNQRPKYDAWLAAKSNRSIWSYQSCDEHGCGDCGTPSTGPDYTGWPNRVIDSSAVQDRAFPWHAFRLDVSGELYFDSSYQLTTAWDDDGQCAFSGSGDGTVFYAGKPSIIGGQTDIPVESIRMKMIREGIEDYEYLVLASKKDAKKAKQIANDLFPHTYESAKSPAELEAAR
ncbi:MAG TPA: glycoside hydrolase domain-containing protein, partial [Minicystis sp.]|nr:glycoside hydrolase domain-containing protein [Minicystis sp.]